MPFRVRLTLALLGIAAIPLALLGVGIRREMSARLDDEAAARVDAAASTVKERFETTLEADRERVAGLARELAGDPRFRLAIASETSAERRWLLDWAARALQAAGLTSLQVVDSSGRVLADGVARGDVGREAATVVRAIDASPLQAALMDSRTAEGAAPVLATRATFAVRSARFAVIGGTRFDSLAVAALSPDRAVSALVVRTAAGEPSFSPPASSGRGSSHARLVTPLPLVDSDPSAPPRMAALMLVPDPRPAAAFKASVARWIVIALLAALAAAALAALLLGRSIAAPVVALGERTARLEREAALGALAQQVNHDVKNGLAPIRNVLRHLVQVAEREPASLARVLSERRGTLEASVAYLEQLARTYARSSPALAGTVTDPRPVVEAIAAAVTAVDVRLRLPDTLPAVRADAIVLQRILENLVSNAVDAIEEGRGTVTIDVETVRDGAHPRVRFTVTDTARGMTREELARALEGSFTTKPGGTGVGLAVVQRLVREIGGSLRADSSPGSGSTFVVEIPAA